MTADRRVEAFAKAKDSDTSLSLMSIKTTDSFD